MPSHDLSWRSQQLTALRDARTVGFVQCEWDPSKAQTNRRKHSVDFPDAIDAREDPLRQEPRRQSGLIAMEALRITSA